MKGNVVTGVGYLVEGARMLTHPSLRLFVLIPLIVNVVLFATALGFSLNYLFALFDQWLAWIPEWLGFIEWLLWPLLWLSISLIVGYTFTAVALIIASPFNALLAEKASKLLYYLPMAAFVLLVSFLPGINLFAPLLWFLLGAWMMSIQFVDYPMDNHQLSFGDVKEAVRSRRLSSMGFGGVVALCTGIPIINFFVVPSAVVGATLLWCRELAREMDR